jgi:hypothetical protein
MRKSNSAQKVASLKVELSKVRHKSLEATRQNDFRRIACLTVQAAQLNKALREVATVE